MWFLPPSVPPVPPGQEWTPPHAGAGVAGGRGAVACSGAVAVAVAGCGEVGPVVDPEVGPVVDPEEGPVGGPEGGAEGDLGEGPGEGARASVCAGWQVAALSAVEKNIKISYKYAFDLISLTHISNTDYYEIHQENISKV